MTTQPTQPQTNNQKQNKPRTMFLEYGEWEKDKQHFISAIVKMPGEKRGKVVARVYLFVDAERKASYIARDEKGNDLFPPAANLFQLKKEIKANAKELYEKVQAYQKEAGEKSAGEKKPVKTFTRKVKEKIQETAGEILDTLAPSSEGVAKSENPETDKVIEGMEREHNRKEKEKQTPKLVEKDDIHRKKPELRHVDDVTRNTNELVERDDISEKRESELKELRGEKENGKQQDKGLSR